jgi:glycosyltransferase involved in cell wall biosynthesis
MKILVLDINYPSDTNLYGDVFVHARVKGYIEHGHEVHVLAFFTRGESYFFEGVAVTCVSSLAELQRTIRAIAPDVIAIHFFQGWMLEKLVKPLGIPVVVWVHGGEALGWYRRLFDLRVNGQFARYAAENTLQLSRMRRLYRYVQTDSTRTALVFVSSWMRNVAAADALCDIKPYEIIPNPIDPGIFRYEEKDLSLRSRVLLIRSFGSRKYANDLAVKAILELRETAAFEQLSFTIVGSGKYFVELTRPLRDLGNVTLVERFMTRDAIRDLHTQHGLFLCPTRQDAQGVSMCEAMSSGLVPITSNNTAIPEFVEHGVNGFLCRSPRDLAHSIKQMWEKPEQFQRMSKAAARSILEKAGASAVIPQEISVMQRVALQ